MVNDVQTNLAETADDISCDKVNNCDIDSSLEPYIGAGFFIDY